MGWDQLLGFIQEAQDIDTQERSTPPADCPICAHTLAAGERAGTLVCPFNDHFVYPDDWVL